MVRSRTRRGTAGAARRSRAPIFAMRPGRSDGHGQTAGLFVRPGPSGRIQRRRRWLQRRRVHARSWGRIPRAAGDRRRHPPAAGTPSGGGAVVGLAGWASLGPCCTGRRKTCFGERTLTFSNGGGNAGGSNTSPLTSKGDDMDADREPNAPEGEEPARRPRRRWGRRIGLTFVVFVLLLVAGIWGAGRRAQSGLAGEMARYRAAGEP